MLKPLLAIAVINKSRPRLKLNDIYSKDQVKDMKLRKDEMFVEVIITVRK